MSLLTMNVLLVEFRIKPAWIERFADAVKLNARASLAAEPGCRQFDVCRDAQDPACFVLYERYDDEACVQAHLDSAHFQHFNATTSAWVASKSVRRLTLAPQ